MAGLSIEFTAGAIENGYVSMEMYGTFTGGSSDDSDVWRYVQLTFDPDDVYPIVIQSTSPGGYDSYFSDTISGFLPGKRYTWTATLGWGGSVSNPDITWTGVTASGSFTTSSGGSGVLWDWYANADRQLAYDALMHNGVTTDFKKQVWLDMIRTVTDCLDSAGMSWDTIYGSGIPPDNSMTAKDFNALLHNVERLIGYSSGIAYKSSGSKIIGSEYIRLMEDVNSWISGG